MTDTEMARLIDEARQDGCTVDQVQEPTPGVLVREPNGPDRFYSKE